MKIVEKYLKLDLHIHSQKSNAKDGELVSNGTKANISRILVPALEKACINMASITDHNVFSYEMYKELKLYENKGGHLLKVLPGIELDVEIEDSAKDTHAIAIFDDSNEEKIKAIEQIVDNKKNKIISERKINEKSLLFKPSDVIDLFRQIGLNFVLIVHQKADPDNNKVNQEHNIADLGVQKFNELVSYDYFDAVEFKSFKVEGFLVAHQNKYSVEYNALCGSDCHDWKCYPLHDSTDKTIQKYCYINALPTFKGLAMSLTGDNRIHFMDSPIRKPYLDKIDFLVSGKPYSVSLSSGLNVLIGDNSIGKSFFLEMLNNPELSKDIVNDNSFNRKLAGYKSFKSRLNFQITSKTLECDNDNVDFHRQGHIRSLFESDNKSIEDQPFLSQYFQVIDTSEQEALLRKTIDDFISYSQTISNYIKQKTKISGLSIVLKPTLGNNLYNLSPLIDKNNLEVTNYNSIISGLSLSRNHLIDLTTKKEMDNVDVNVIDSIIENINKLIIKYKIKQVVEDLKESSYSIVVEKMNAKKKEISEKSTEEETQFRAYQSEKADFVQSIVSFFGASIQNNVNNFDVPEKIVVSDVSKPHDKYNFISRVKHSVITRSDIYDMLVDPIKNISDFSKIKDVGFDVIASKLDSETTKLPFNSSSEKYKEACISYFKTNWLQKEKGSIVDKNKSVITGNSAGLNAQYYLDLYTLLERKKLFIIDQPEDDVSEARISTELKTIMRNMAQREQIIFVTHNAELVVNLDVDNVVVFKNDGHDLMIKNGALEYEDSEINILNEVANLLDGGAEVIRKRWKRYEKNKIIN